MDWKIIAAILAPIITAVGAYMVAKRTTSGKIDTSDAAILWVSAETIRKELRDEVVALRTELLDTRAACKKDITKLNGRIKELENHK